MPDLVTLFQKGNQKSPQSHSLLNSNMSYKNIQIRSSYSSSKDEKLNPPEKHNQQLYQSIIPDSFTKQIILSNSMNKEIASFNRMYKIQGIINMVIMGSIISFLCLQNLITFLTAQSIFIYFFFFFSLKYNFYRLSIIKNWAYLSLLSSYFILNYIFYGKIMLYLNPLFIKRQFISTSMLPALQASIIAFIFLKINQSLIFQIKTPQNLIQTIYRAPSSLLYCLKNLFESKFSLMGIYILLLIIETIGLLYTQNFSIYEAKYIFSLYILISQFLACLIIGVLEYLLSEVINQTVSKFLLNSSYMLKQVNADMNYSMKKNNMIPIMIELLRLDQKQNVSQQNAKRIHKKSLDWILNLLSWNPDCLSTQINSSKFYNSYWDIFGQYSQKCLKNSSNYLKDLKFALNQFKILQKNYKNPLQDLFYCFKFVKAAINIQRAAIRWANSAVFIQTISRILVQANPSTQWSSQNLQTHFEQIQQKINELQRQFSHFIIIPVAIKKMKEHKIRIKYVLSKLSGLK